MSAIVEALVRMRTAQKRGAAMGRDLARQDAAAALEAERGAARERRDVERFDLDKRQAEWQLGSEDREQARQRAARQAFRRDIAPRVLGADAAQLDDLPDDADVSPIVEAIVKRRAADRDFTQRVQLQDRSFGQQSRLAAMADARAERAAMHADARAASKPVQPTDGERTAAGFLPRLNESKTQLDSANVPGRAAIMAGDRAPLFASEDYRAWNLARRNFATALLRRESGASISPTEFSDIDSIYIPLPGDSDAIKAKKARNRALAMQQMTIGAGRAAGMAMTPNGVPIPADAPSADTGAATGSAIMDELFAPRRTESLSRQAAASTPTPAGTLPFGQWEAQRRGTRGARP